jgi:DeoR family transcriptional regulator, glycerol-3-phosphate regulon repressor
VANGLASHEDLLVITNHIHVAMLLYGRPRIEVIVAGGPLRRSDGGIIGSAAVGLIRQFKVDFAIIGASAIESDGTLLDFDYQEVQVAQSILENARHAMLVADSSKLRRSAPVRIAHIGQVQTWVTDGVGDSPVRDVCAERGVRLIEAAPQFAADDDAGGQG